MKSVGKILSNILISFGALWLFVEVFDYFGGKSVSLWLQKQWWIFLFVGLGIAIWKCIPKRKYVFPIKGRDCKIEIVIGDILKQQGPVVVGSNRQFVVDETIISSKSLQGQFCKKYYKDTKALNAYIQQELGNDAVDFGTTVKINGVKKTAYFCAIADINDHGVAHSTKGNILRSLSVLWDYLASHAEKDFINVPILGSGFSRVDVPRELLAHEIVRSFMAALSQSSNFCDGMRLVIYPKDIKDHKFDLEEFIEFVGYTSKYAIPETVLTGQGVPIN